MPYESLRGKKERDLEILLQGRRVREWGGDREKKGDLSGKSQPERTTLVSMSCSDKAPQLCVLGGKGPGFEGDKSALVIAADG